MKYAIISDIHSNLEALEAVLKDAKEQKCTHHACAGDVVGYGASPKDCLDIIRIMGMPVVKGNHDEYCATDEGLVDFNPNAAKAVAWTRKQLSREDRKWLHELPYTCIVDGFSLVHGTLDGPRRWGYVFDKLAAAAHFTHQSTFVCFFGHTHVPIAFVRDSMIRGGTYSKFRVEREKRYFINPGSVGQPRDGDRRAAYLTYDLGTGDIELRRIDYDWETAVEKVKRAGLPTRLGGSQ